MVFDVKLENSVIKGINLFMDNGEVFLDAEILETSKGKDLKALIDQKVPVGISMRALGNSVQRSINGRIVDVATFLDIQSFDIVMNPAAEGCGVVEVLTDSQIQEILETDPVIEDGIQHTSPMCPSCNCELASVDPDNDGDTDFYECPTCNGVFFADNYLSSSINASTELRKMNTSDYDRYSQVQNYLAAKKASSNSVTDSIKGDDIVNKEDLLKLINEDVELRKAMEGIAAQTAKPALDAVEQQKLEEQKAQAKIEAKAFIDEKIRALKGKMDEKVIKVITDAIDEPESKEQAQVVYDAALKLISDASAAQILATLGFDGKTTGEGGHTTIEVTNNAKPWMPIVDNLVKAFDEYVPLLVAGEAATAGALNAVSNETNVTYKYNLTLKGTASSTAGTNPIVRPRTKNQIQPNGSVQQVTANPFSITVGANTLVVGYLDANGNIQGTGAQYAVDFENGIVYFSAASGVSGTALPTFSYSGVTNYDRWSMTVPSGMKAEDYYNTFLQRLTNTSALMGSAPRYKKPNLAIFSLNSATFVENAQMFYKLAQPEGS